MEFECDLRFTERDVPRSGLVSRNATDVHHVVTAVGSRSTESAKAFIERTIPSAFQKDVKPCSSYAEVYADPNVDACYIGTPHTYHYENTKDALNAGRHVLCEKVSRESSPFPTVGGHRGLES